MLCRFTDDQSVETEGHEYDSQRGEQAGAPAQVETAQLDRARQLEILDEKRRDQIAGQDEEDRDAQVATAHQTAVRVHAEYAEDGKRPDAVEFLPAEPGERRDGGTAPLRVRAGHQAGERC